MARLPVQPRRSGTGKGTHPILSLCSPDPVFIAGEVHLPLSPSHRWRGRRLFGALRLRLTASACLLLAPAPEAGAIAYRQAPMLEEAVRRGELPPLAERLPPEPMVVTPAHEIGRYGGTWHRMMRGSSDFHAYSRCVYEQMVRWRATEAGGLEVGPGLVRRWEFADGDRTLRLHLRRGLRWSDGHPFSAGDVLFWWEKIARDPNLSGTVPRYWTPDDEPMELVRVDSFTVELRFARPYPLAVKYLAFKGNQWPLVFERAGFYAPRHYLEPYLPAEGAEDLAGYSLFEQKANDFNPERPVMSAWRVAEWEPGSHLLAERNPYYWKVDPAGNQLPYLDRIRMEIFLNREMINFRAVTGSLQMQLRHFNREDLPLLRSFTEERGYRIIEYDAPGIRGIMPNLEYPGDPVVRELLKNRHLRIALSLAIDRELINRLCYGGSGRVTPMALHPSAPDYVEVPEAPDHTRYDPERARALLDSIGLDRRDDAGFRLGPDCERVSLILELMVVEGPDMDAVEIVRSQWEEVGIQTALKPEERTLYHQRVTQNGEHMIGIVGAEATFPLLSSPRWFATSLWAEWAHHWARWYLSEGRRGAEPPPEVKRLQEIQSIMSVTVDRGERQRLWREVIANHAENMWVIPLVTQGSQIGVLSDDFGNVPERAISSWVTMTPGYLSPETFFSRGAGAGR